MDSSESVSFARPFPFLQAAGMVRNAAPRRRSAAAPHRAAAVATLATALFLHISAPSLFQRLLFLDSIFMPESFRFFSSRRSRCHLGQRTPRTQRQRFAGGAVIIFKRHWNKNAFFLSFLQPNYSVPKAIKVSTDFPTLSNTPFNYLLVPCISRVFCFLRAYWVVILYVFNCNCTPITCLTTLSVYTITWVPIP